MLIRECDEIQSAALRLRRLAAENVVNGADDHARLFARQPVVDRLALTARGDKPVSAQPRELLGHRGLALPEEALELGHRLLAFREAAENEQPAFVRERLEEIARAARLLDQLVELVRVDVLELCQSHGA